MEATHLLNSASDNQPERLFFLFFPFLLEYEPECIMNLGHLAHSCHVVHFYPPSRPCYFPENPHPVCIRLPACLPYHATILIPAVQCPFCDRTLWAFSVSFSPPPMGPGNVGLHSTSVKRDGSGVSE